MKFIWVNLYKINHNFYSFISGVVITISLDLLMTILGGEDFPSSRWLIITTISSIMTLISSFYWSMIAWNLDETQNSANEAPGFIDNIEVWNDLIDRNLPRVRLFFIIAISYFIFGIALLPLRFVDMNGI